MYEVSSEIYAETDFQPIKCDNGQIISKFKFFYPCENSKKAITSDTDGDIDVIRKNYDTIEIEHSGSTVLKLVGLQVWRGALLLADYIFHNRKEFSDKHILELGAGVGLTSIAAAIYSSMVVCTDVDIGGILDVIKRNVDRNKSLFKSQVHVFELDFKAKNYSTQLIKYINDCDIVFAADVIYDDDLTDNFINVIDDLLDKKHAKAKTIFIALEKRYVFTLVDLETVAPCFDYFLKNVAKKPWQIDYIPINFPQYFFYQRCKDLVLLKIVRR